MRDMQDNNEVSKEQHVSPPAEAKAREGSPTPKPVKKGVSQQKLEANRRNAKKSPGPTTEAGKARSAANSFKHGFFARQLFPTNEQWNEDGDEYNRLAKYFHEYFQPVGFWEEFQIELILTDAMRLRRLLREEQAHLSCAVWRSGGSVMRYLAAVDRQLGKKIRELERLQDKRKAESASPDGPESDENETNPPSDDPTPADDGGVDSCAEDTVVLPLDESKAEEDLDAVAKPASENAGTNPIVTAQ